ncbi:hypothetical protein D1007_30456 [Hordeum vulgare]|nr:hypothetical protein D1007_30456 [Hordeum vulgare]
MAGPGVVAAASRLSLLLLLVAVFGGFSPDSRTVSSSSSSCTTNDCSALLCDTDRWRRFVLCCVVQEAAVRTCTYTVKVKTSCASPARTSDAVSVAFGDAYRNEAYGARLPPGAFERTAFGTATTAAPRPKHRRRLGQTPPLRLLRLWARAT